MAFGGFSRTVIGFGVLAVLGAPAPAAAQADERQIDISLVSPPSLAPAIDLRLSRDGADITDSACGPLVTPVDSASPQRVCAGLGDGAFAVSLTGAPADAIVTWDCIDITAARTDHTYIPLGGGYTNWWCSAMVSPPGVVIDGTSSVDDTGAPLDDLELVIEDDTGTAIPPCELDRRGGIDRQWCVPLADGTYEAVPQDVPAGLRAAAACASSSSVSDDPPGTFTIDAGNPLWYCGRPVPYEPLRFGVSWAGATGRDLGWFLGTEPTVADAGGVDVSSACSERQRSVAEPTNLFIEYACVGLAPGTYTVRFSGIPSDFEVTSDCEPVEVPEEPGPGYELCYVHVTSEPLDVPTQPPHDDPPELPATGTASPTLLLAGLAAFVSGSALLLAGRRRSLG